METSTISMDITILENISSEVKGKLSSISYDRGTITSAFSSMTGQGIGVSIISSICDGIEALMKRIDNIADDLNNVSLEQQTVDNELATASLAFTEDFTNDTSFSSVSKEVSNVSSTPSSSVTRKTYHTFLTPPPPPSSDLKADLNQVGNGSTSIQPSSNPDVSKKELRRVKENEESKFSFPDLLESSTTKETLLDITPESNETLLQYEFDAFYDYFKDFCNFSLVAIYQVIENEETFQQFFSDYCNAFLTVDFQNQPLINIKKMIYQRIGSDGDIHE